MLVRRVLRIFWWCFAAVVVSLAVALSAARLLLPAMSEYREQIESVAQRLVQRPVEIGQLDAAWRGLSPVLRLKQVVIRDSRFPDGVLVVDEVQVGLDVIESAHTQLLVFDMLGRRVATLLDETLQPGSHTRTFDGSALPSGIYIAVLNTPTITKTMRMLLAK